MKKLPIFLLAVLVIGFVASCVDNDDDVPMNYYQSKKVTAAGFLEENQEQFSEFIAILKRTPYFSMLSTYGTFTLFAPNNEAIGRYLSRSGYGSVDNIPTETCDTLARTHIIKKGAFFTTDIGEGALPELNMDDSYIVLSSDSDVNNHNALVYYINKNSRMIDYNDSVTNGVVHVINNVISSSSLLLPDKIAEDPELTLFSQALSLTGMCDSLTKYLDESYYCSEDSVHEGVMVRCTSGSALYTRSFWPEKRYFKYTAFVEPDSVYHNKGINNIEDLKAYAKSVYDQTFPEDAGKYDDNPKDRRNPLNRFVSYHLLPRIGQYNSWVMSGELREHCWYTSLSDPEEFYETMCPGTMMRFAGPPAGLFINRKGLQNRFTVDSDTLSTSGKSALVICRRCVSINRPLSISRNELRYISRVTISGAIPLNVSVVGMKKKSLPSLSCSARCHFCRSSRSCRFCISSRLRCISCSSSGV